MNKTILLVNTFPISGTLSGGQKREVALVEAYKKVFDTVEYVGVFFKDYYKDYAPTDIPLSAAWAPKVHADPHIVDMICGNAIYDDPSVKRAMTATLRRLKPDYIQIEQAFPYLGLKRLLAELGMAPKIIFSTHNVEAPMKREILEGVGTPKARIKEIVTQIAELERELAQTSEFVIACTESDADFFKSQGAKKVVVARNGMAPIRTTEAAMARLHEQFTREGIVKKVLFVAAAHPPNWVGFLEMVGTKVGFLEFDTRLLLAGGVCDYLQSTISEEYNPAHLTFWQRVVACGRPTDDELGALIKQADVIILPLTQGGGSNLKTAEAILADKMVVATSHAFRSFEELKNLPNIFIADTPAKFRIAIEAALHCPKLPRTAAEQRIASGVLWDNCMEPVVREARGL